MDLLGALNRNVTAVIGLDRGSGKTTFLNYALPIVRQVGPVAVATIGAHQGPEGTPASASTPTVYLQAQDLAVTTLPLARTAAASLEILDLVPGRSSLGRLVIGRARRPGIVPLVGPEHLSNLAQAWQTIKQQGWAASILIDGAVNRVTQVSSLGNLQFVCTARVDYGNLASSTTLLAMLDQLSHLPLTSNLQPSTEALLSIQGPLVSSFLPKIPRNTEELSLEDFTKIFLSPSELATLTKRCKLSVRRQLRLACFVVALKGIGEKAFYQALGPDFASPILLNPFAANFCLVNELEHSPEQGSHA